MNFKKISTSLPHPAKISDGEIHVGDPFDNGSVKGKVKEIHEDHYVIESQNDDGDIEDVQVAIEDSAHDGRTYKPDHYLSVNEAGDKWDEVKEILGAEKMLDAVFQMLDVDTNVWILENLSDDYDLDLFED